MRRAAQSTALLGGGFFEHGTERVVCLSEFAVELERLLKSRYPAGQISRLTQRLSKLKREVCVIRMFFRQSLEKSEALR